MSKLNIIPDTRDILIGIYSNFPKKINKYEYDFEKFHTFFYDNVNRSMVLCGTDFHNNGKFYWSPKLECARNNLIDSKIITFDSGLDIINNLFIENCWKQFIKKKFSFVDKLEIKVLSNKFIENFI
jgi:hypothetical protein